MTKGSSTDLDGLKSHPSIPRLYGNRMQLHFDGKEYVGRCPFPGHDDRTPSFRIYNKSGVWMWTCFGKCNATGNIFQFIERLDGCGFDKATRLVRDHVGNSWEEKTGAVDATFKPALKTSTEVKTLTAAQWDSYVKACEQSPHAQEFLRSRGISAATAVRCRVGFTPDVGKLAGDRNADITAKGWLAFPSFDGDRVVNVKLRSVVRKAFCHLPGMRKPPWIFNAESISGFEPIYVVEGELDALALEEAGFSSVSLPSGGTKPTPELIKALREAEKIILAGDTDDTGTAAMKQFWDTLGSGSWLLKWPAGMKDADQTLLEFCKGDVSVFRTEVGKLTAAALAVPMPYIVSAQEALTSQNRVQLIDHPERLRFPWPSIDKMAILLPGSVLSVMASKTGMGKSVWTMNVLADAAARGETVLVYSAEMSDEEYTDMLAAHLALCDRSRVTTEARRKAAARLGDAGFYIGYNPDLDTIDPVLDLIEAAIERLGATIVVLDHFHHVCRVASGEKETVVEAKAMQRIKSIAAKHGVKFINICQPRKPSQQSRGKVADITDAKGSEAIISDSSAFIILHREDAKILDPMNPPKDPFSPITQIHLKKGRSLAGGPVFSTLHFDGATATFYEATDREPPPNL